GDGHPTVHELAQRDESGEEGLAEAFPDHLFLAPAKADARGHLEARGGIPTDLLGLEEVAMLKDPAGWHPVGSAHVLQVVIVLSQPGRDDVQPQPLAGAELDRTPRALAR